MTSFLEAQAQTGTRGNPPREYSTGWIRVTAERMRSIVADPLELVPAPGPGKVVVPLSLMARGEGGEGFSGSPTICWDADPALGPILPVDSITGYPAPFLAVGFPPDGLRDAKENAGLFLTVDGEEMTGGDYGVELRVEYSIVEL